MQVYLTDAPGDYEAVYIDIRGIEVNTINDTFLGWVGLRHIQPGVYDLLTLVNDKDTLLADAEILSAG